MGLEQQFSDAIVAQNALTQTVAGKMEQIDEATAAQKAAFESWMAGHVNEHAAIAVNKNASFLDVSGTAPQKLPVGMGVHAGGDFWNKFSVELIPVVSGVDPGQRAPVVRELLKFMNMDNLHFSAGFNIIALTVKSIAAGFGPYVFHIPNQHIKVGCFMSFVAYHKIMGNADWGWCNNAVKGRWEQVTHHLYAGDGAGDYVHIDIRIWGVPAVGDTLYLALPQVIVGKWNPNHRCPQLFNVGAGLGS